MRFLADENFPQSAVRALEGLGHNIVWIRTAAPASPDAVILAWTVRDDRILLTFDKDFGELARITPLPPSCGVLLFRMPIARSREAGSHLAHIITSREDWAGHFSVIEPGRVRMRKLVTP